MKISKIENHQKFGNTTTLNTTQPQEKPKKRELIDVITDNVRNPRDINDCVAVPRGIFKAYISLMAGTGLMAMANYLPKKAQKPLNIIGCALNILSAYYFAKPFAFKGNSPTVKKEDLKN